MKFYSKIALVILGFFIPLVLISYFYISEKILSINQIESDNQYLSNMYESNKILLDLSLLTSFSFIKSEDINNPNVEINNLQEKINKKLKMCNT